MTILVIGHYFAGDIERQGQITLFPTSVTGVFSTFSIIVFAFTGHQNMFSIINEARDKSLTSLTKLVEFCHWYIQFVIYCCWIIRVFDIWSRCRW